MEKRQVMLARSSNKKYTPLMMSDYLLGVHDVARMGGLRFKSEEDRPFVAKDSSLATPVWARLRELQYGVSKIEEDTESAEIRKMVGPR